MNDTQTRVLLYVSHPVLAEVTAFRLHLLGLAPIIANSGSMLFAKLDEALPDVVIVDLDVDTGSGLQIIEQLSSNEVTSLIPILCMSAEGDLNTAEKAFAAGAREFLVVPYDPVTLEEKIIRLVARAANERALRHQSQKQKLVPLR